VQERAFTCPQGDGIKVKMISIANEEWGATGPKMGEEVRQVEHGRGPERFSRASIGRTTKHLCLEGPQPVKGGEGAQVRVVCETTEKGGGGNFWHEGDRVVG